MDKFIKYQNFTTQELLQDETFISLVRRDTPEADCFWLDWKQKYPEKSKQANQARKIILSLRYENAKEPEDLVYNEILENVLKSKYLDLNVYQSPLVRRSNTLYRYAAAIVFLITFSIVIFWFQQNQPPATTSAPIAELKVIEKQSHRGTKLSFVMTDGTYVKLNSESSLHFPKRFDPNIREVTLKGEAFFNVAKDDARPFVINSGDLEITVTGTAFNVQVYPEQKNIEVSVLEGTVEVVSKTEKQEQTGIEINAMEIASFSKNTNTIYKADLKDLRRFEWRDNIIEFRGEEFRDIEKKLSRWFNVDFILTEKTIIQGRYTGKFKNKSLREILDGLGFASGLNFEIIDNHVYVNNVNSK